MRVDSKRPDKGFAFTELLVVIALLAALLMVVLPSLAKRYSKSSKINCSVNLKQIALAFKMYAGDNDGKLPWIPESRKIDFINHEQVWEYFQVISNELGTPKVLVCPNDVRSRQPAEDFTDGPKGLVHPSKQNGSISYFLNMHAQAEWTNSIIAGDRTLMSFNGDKLYSSSGTIAVQVAPNSTWSSASAEKSHDGVGNLALSDGSVQQTSNARLQEALRLARDSYGTNANLFLFPQ